MHRSLPQPPGSTLLCLLLTSYSIALGCSRPAPEEFAAGTRAPRKSLPFRVLVVDDSRLAEALERHWRARAEGEIDVREMGSREIAELDGPRLGADIVVYPSAVLGELVSRELIVPLDNEALADVRLARSDIFPLQLLGEARWGASIYAVPFGSPQLTLHYRLDVFDAMGIEPPRTWSEYEEVVEQLSQPGAADDVVPHEQPWYVVAEPLGPGWAGKVLLARAAAYARHRSQYSTLFDLRTMEPLIDGPPFVRALTELIAVARRASSEAAAYSPSDVLREFDAGRCAMALCWQGRAIASESADAPAVAYGFAELPGSRAVYNFRQNEWEQRQESEDGRVTLLGLAGRLGSVTAECRNPDAAVTVLLFFTGLELGQEIASESDFTTLYRESQIETAGRWVSSELDVDAARRYGETVQAAQNRKAWLACPRIPGQAAYLAALDAAVHQCLAGEATPAEALAAAAESWRRITESYGLEKQKAAYSRSVGLER